MGICDEHRVRRIKVEKSYHRENENNITENKNKRKINENFKKIMAKKVMNKDMDRMNNNEEIDQIRKSVLNVHNILRSTHETQELNLNNKLNEMAQTFAEKCAASSDGEICCLDLYKNDENGEYEMIGHNIAVIKNNNNVLEICQKWYNEKYNYNFDSNKYIDKTGHFTQMIWKSTTDIGIGYKESQDGIKYFIVYYYPAGNIFNKFKENVNKEKQLI